MNAELLEIQPKELKFIFESKKQSSCSVRLTNKSDYHVAFKVKTTCSQKYCVRPNTGVVKPSLTCDFTVTMQAQNVAPTDFICMDKFLIQSTIVPPGTKEEHITSTTFQGDDKHIEEKKLRVILVSPPHSPVLSPMNEISRMRPYNAATESKDDLVQNNRSRAKVDEDIEIEVSRRGSRLVETVKNEQSIERKHTEELRLSNDVEEMKSKLRELESILRQDSKLRTERSTEPRAQIGFQLVFVFVVAVASLYLGYLLHG
ncbi:vesicle-associated protein 1-1-like [Cynara cardunculus var. scolymus]|uniref:vesicle-associated protein 1-1-like n=1 Tax=Cynara cardunculus var. scolymus TaxID=59895 RepID=UPI000D623079|nr:vesicle-associated protein 1-1-like [Cynara cardunculus var. scolymus]